MRAPKPPFAAYLLAVVAIVLFSLLGGLALGILLIEVFDLYDAWAIIMIVAASVGTTGIFGALAVARLNNLYRRRT